MTKPPDHLYPDGADTSLPLAPGLATRAPTARLARGVPAPGGAGAHSPSTTRLARTSACGTPTPPRSPMSPACSPPRPGS